MIRRKKFPFKKKNKKFVYTWFMAWKYNFISRFGFVEHFINLLNGGIYVNNRMLIT